MNATLIALGITLLLVLVAFYDGRGGKALGALVVLGSALWVSWDSSRIRIRDYNTRLAGHPIALFFGAYILWIVVFPWYLVVRSKIRAGQIERVKQEVRGFGFYLGVGLVSLVALAIAAIVVSRLVEHGEATEAVAGRATPQASTVAPNAVSIPANSALDQQQSEMVRFDSTQSLLEGEERVRGKLISLKATVSSVDDDKIDLATGDDFFNWSVVCQPSPDQRERVQALKLGQDIAIVSVVPKEGATQLRAPSSEHAGLYELQLTGCRLQ